VTGSIGRSRTCLAVKELKGSFMVASFGSNFPKYDLHNYPKMSSGGFHMHDEQTVLDA
jgi:hypothetical protein